VQWQDIEKVMHTLEKPNGGFTLAHRGIVTMPDGRKIFVKIGIDDETKRWTRKEIIVYMFLQKHNYPYIPKFLACSADKTGFALEALTEQDGWNWAEAWNKDRLAATLHAMDELAAVKVSFEEKNLFGEKGITRDTDGWHIVQNSEQKQALLRTKLIDTGYADLAAHLDIHGMAVRSADYVFADDIVVHQDIRADNCAWCPQEKTVKLIDWSWTQIGDRRIDTNAMLVHVHKSGLDVLHLHPELLNANVLEWLAGFWFNASTNPLRANNEHNEHLQEYLLESGVTALQLADKVRLL
jgi:hypothetical protein